MATERGFVKKVEISQFGNVRRSGLMAIKVKDEDRLIWTKPTSGKDQLMLVTSNGQSIRFKEADVRAMGRNASGVAGVRLKKGDKVVGMGVIPNDPATAKLMQSMVIGEKGFGKRSALSLYKVQSRAGSGIKTFKVTSKTGELVNAYVVNSVNMKEKDLIIISEKGQVIRLPFKSVPALGRDTQGVRLMRFKDGNDKIANVTWI
jgi:DNA gyrase subunit A